MVGLEEETSNQLFEILEQWEHELRQLDTNVLEVCGDDFGGPEL